MKTKIIILLILLTIIQVNSLNLLKPITTKTALAQDTLLPKQPEESCKIYLVPEILNNLNKHPNKINDILACAVKEGKITLNMIPYFMKYIAEVILSMIGLIAVLFIVIGGYYYIWGGVTEEKEKGKKTIINALLGIIIATLSWVIVSAIIYAVTS